MPRAGYKKLSRLHIFGPHAAYADEALKLFAQFGRGAWSREALVLGLSDSPLFSLQLLLVTAKGEETSFSEALAHGVEQLGEDLLCLWLHICAARGDLRQPAHAALGLHARRTAALASRLATETALCDGEQARVAGMWHNLGQVELCWRPGYPGPVSDLREKQLASGEARQYGDDHAGLLAQRIEGLLDMPWLYEAIELHHAPADFVAEMPGLVRVLRAAVILLAGEPQSLESAARLTGLDSMRLAQLMKEVMASPVLEAYDAAPALPAPMLAGMLRQAFADLSPEQRATRLRAGCALLGQRELLLSLRRVNADLQLDPFLVLAPDLHLPALDHGSRCALVADVQAEQPLAPADWLLARQLGVSAFECLPWEHAGVAGVAVFAEQTGRPPLLGDAVDSRALGLLLDAAHAAATRTAQNEAAISRAVEEGVTRERTHARRVAHEVSNPLTVISNYLGILDADTSLAQPVRDMQRQMRAEMDRIQRLLRKLGSGAPEEQPATSCMPNGVLRDVEALFYETLLVRQEIRLELQLADEVPEVAVSPDALKQILVNLTLNAAEAIGHHGSILLRSSVDVNLDGQGWIEVCVEDSGPGLPRSSPLLELPISSSKSEGRAGVGLSVIQTLVSQAGGRLLCRSRIGAGTCFSVFLPRSVSADPAQAAG